MKTMVSVCFMVFVLFGVQKVFGADFEENPRTCDECMRFGGQWCSELGNAGCNMSPDDSSCPRHAERPYSISSVSRNGHSIWPIYVQKSIVIDQYSIIKFNYTSDKPLQVNINVVNTTQHGDIDVFVDFGVVKCSEGSCTTYIKAKASSAFCTNTGTIEEYAHAQVSIGNLSETAIIKYHVPCACQCSQQSTKLSFKTKSIKIREDCSGHGHFSCGICNCEPGWKGNKCEEDECEDTSRGDINQSICKNMHDNDLVCWGNGRCKCDKCECDMTLEGSQYFDSETCTDLCMDVNECPDCTDCMFNSTISECDIVGITHKQNNMRVLKKNISLIDEWDYSKNKKKWVRCNVTVRDCEFSYVAKRTEDDEVYIMVIKSCNDVIAGAATAAPTVSIVLGVLGLIAAVMAVAGVVIWKQMNSIPPVPLNGAGYTDIDAEDCVGENPLYKPPTSSFKNPTYGQKW